jgi:NAD(P)-dependent dehydrogenase (short-subunit alcohol dehydrogenase family)
MERSQQTLRGQEILITGGTDGIGKETARVLALMGANVTILGRDKKKGDEVINAFRAQGASSVRFFSCDLSSQASIHTAAETVHKFVPRINVLINNAGGVFASRRVNADGIEMTWGLNHVAYYLLTQLLLERIKASAPARIVNVSSRLHMQGALNFDDLEMRKGYSGLKAYNNSKLANVCFTYALARRLAKDRVSVNCLHPGFVASKFGHNNVGLTGLIMRLAQSVAAVNVEKGAKTSIYLASSPEVEGVTGKYFTECKPAASSDSSNDAAVQERLWQVTAQMTGVG